MERGVDATGVAFLLDGKKLEIHKAPVPAAEFVIGLPPQTQAAIGHVRATTHGAPEKLYNNHPFKGVAQNTRFALAHNGIITNYRKLQRQYKLPVTAIETDSYVAVQLIEREGRLSLDVLRNVAEMLEGSFVFTILDLQNNIYFVRNNNPIEIVYIPQLKLWVYASMPHILYGALLDFFGGAIYSQLYPAFVSVPVVDGDILRISPTTTLDTIERTTFTPNIYAPRYWFIGGEDYLKVRKGVKNKR